MTYILIEVPDDLHRKLKLKSVDKKLSMKKMILKIFEREVKG